MTAKPETPDTVHGRLLESVHLSGYSAERACGELQWLLDEDRWQHVGGGFTDIDAFLDATNLGEFKLVTETRQRIVKRLGDLRAGQRATARLLGVNKETIARDLGLRGANAPTDPESPSDDVPASGANAPIDPVLPSAWFQVDADPTREAKREARKVVRDEERATKRADAAAAAQAATTADTDAAIHHGSFTTIAESIAPESVALVFTDPPYNDQSLSVYDPLGRVAARVLRDGGSLITYAAQHRIPEVIAMLQASGLTFFWPIAMIHTGAKARMTEYGIVVHWKPLLWFVKGRFRSRDDMQFVNDLIESTPQKDAHPWQQSVVEARYYIDALTVPGDLVFDPFCGGGTTAVAAAQAARRWVTCDVDEESVWIARQRLREIVA